MKETKYITIGTPIISNDIFRNILRPLDNFSLKPTGGLWASKFNLPYGKICPWFDYLLDARGIARSISEYRDLTKATIFTLKEDANILTINTSNQILELSKKYPSYYQSLNYIYEITERNTIFDYEALSKVYDGIYINYEEIYREIKSEVFDSWSIDTLLLFNLNCIKEYQSVKINVNFHDLYPLPYIDMKKDLSTPKLISNRSINYNEIYNYCCTKLNFSRTAAEDVTQEVFFALYKKLDRLKLSENIRIWLYRAADLEIKNYIRHNPSFVSLEECSDEISAAPIDFPFLSDNDLDCLSDKDKAIISDYYNGEDKESIAKANEMTLNALYIHIHRIRKKLAVSARKANKLRL